MSLIPRWPPGRSTRAISKVRSEYGLGHLRNPTVDNTDWITQAWDHLRHPDSDEPDWLDLPAVSQITITGAELLAWFRHINHAKPYRDQIKPANFLLIAHPDPLTPGDYQPIASIQRRPHQLVDDAVDRPPHRPTHHHRHETPRRHHPTRPLPRAHLPRRHRPLPPPPRSQISRPHWATRRPKHHRLLRRRPVTAVEPVVYIGKEGHNLDRRASGLDTDDDLLTYTPTPLEHWHQLVVPVLRTIPARTIADATGINIRTVQRALAQHSTPRPTQRDTLTRYAVEHCRTALGAKPTEPDTVTLKRFLLRNGS